MPIYEYKCINCMEFFEKLVMRVEGNETVTCPKCGSTAPERVMSATNYAMTGGGDGAASVPSAQTRTCSGGSCTTYNIPGPK
ncbi:MAG: zinc ribbon domain-containing protein [Desulfobacterales bacterium]|nr:zinc ribbon domain-containing protein [Desulfobacterales bacterium]